MNEYKKCRDIPCDVTVTSQSRLFCAIFNTFAENYPFLVVFNSVSIERGRGQILHFVCVLTIITNHNYVFYKNINLVHELALY